MHALRGTSRPLGQRLASEHRRCTNAALCLCLRAPIGARGNSICCGHRRRRERQSRRCATRRTRARGGEQHRPLERRGTPRAVEIAETSSAEAARDLALTWHRRANAASRRAHHPPKLKIWNCIHGHEGSWSDPNAPYWGGLQMDYSFQSAYGAWLLRHVGTANRWTPLEQIWTGVRAWRVSGFAPWSTTAHACGVY